MIGLRRRRPANGQPAVDWSELADGRLRRFKRGKHYTGSPDMLQQEARAAAEELGKKAIVSKDQLGKWEYVWVQFLDGELEEGRACSNCGSRSMEILQRYFLRCPSCQSVYVIETTDASGPDPSTVAEVTSVRMLSPDGAEIVEAGMDEEIVIEATCDILRAVDRATAHFTFFTVEDDRKALRAACPDTIGVPEPQTVAFSLHIGAGVLDPDDYMVVPTINIFIQPGMDRVRVKQLDPFLFRVRGPEPAASEDDGGQERSSLRWTITMPSGPEPPPED